MNSLRYLASYPKSGNTWARIFLYTYITDPDEPLHPNVLKEQQFAPSDDEEWVYNAALGLRLENCPELVSVRLRAHVQQFLRRKMDKMGHPPFVKSHAQVRDALEVHPTIDFTQVYRSVYFVRNPLGVIPSLASHTGAGYDEMIKCVTNPGYGIARPNKIFTPLGRWDEHVTSWEPHATVIRYEDLPQGFELMLDVFGIEFDQDRFDKAVEFTRMDILQEKEAETPFEEQSKKNNQFFGGKHRKLNRPQVRKICEAFAEKMEEYRYADSQSQTLHIRPRGDSRGSEPGQSVLVHDAGGPAPGRAEGEARNQDPRGAVQG